MYSNRHLRVSGILSVDTLPLLITHQFPTEGDRVTDIAEVERRGRILSSDQSQHIEQTCPREEFLSFTPRSLMPASMLSILRAGVP